MNVTPEENKFRCHLQIERDDKCEDSPPQKFHHIKNQGKKKSKNRKMFTMFPFAHCVDTVTTSTKGVTSTCCGTFSFYKSNYCQIIS